MRYDKPGRIFKSKYSDSFLSWFVGAKAYAAFATVGLVSVGIAIEYPSDDNFFWYAAVFATGIPWLASLVASDHYQVQDMDYIQWLGDSLAGAIHEHMPFSLNGISYVERYAHAETRLVACLNQYLKLAQTHPVAAETYPQIKLETEERLDFHSQLIGQAKSLTEFSVNETKAEFHANVKTAIAEMDDYRDHVTKLMHAIEVREPLVLRVPETPRVSVAAEAFTEAKEEVETIASVHLYGTT